MKELKSSVLGTDYRVVLGEREEIDITPENSGECRIYSKEIKVCTDIEDCSQEELRVRTQEVVAHEFFHAYINEAGIDLQPEMEELLATFFMKNWKKLHKSIVETLGENGFLDK